MKQQELTNEVVAEALKPLVQLFLEEMRANMEAKADKWETFEQWKKRRVNNNVVGN